MHLIWIYVFGLMGLLGLAALLLPASKRLNFPYTVLLAAVGCFLGFAIKALENKPVLIPIHDFLSALKGFEITSNSVFFIFLPALVFEAALAINVRRLMDDIAPILFLAIIGLLISTVVIAFPLSAVSGISIIVCLLLGVIASATDPVAVVAIFKEVGAPKRLSILVEGESLFNDATAIVVFTILVAMITGPSVPGFLYGASDFLRIFFGGIVIGFITSRIVCWIIGLLDDLPLVAITLTISMAYLTFIWAEHYFHVSGVMAVVAAALVIGSRGRTVLSPESWDSVHNTWEHIGFWANSIIFILVGITVPNIMTDFVSGEWVLLAVLILTAFIARAFIIFILIPVLSYFNLSQTVSTSYKAVMFWGGLRGAVSLALALAVIENHQLNQDIRDFIGILITGFVLFTLFVNATTIRLVINSLGLGRLSATEMAIRDRATACSLEKIENRLNQVSNELGVDENINEQVVKTYHTRSESARKDLNGIAPSQWIIVGLSTLTAQERNAYTEQYAKGLLSSLTYRLLITQTDDIADALKQNGCQGYKEMAAKSLDFDWRFHFAAGLQRTFGITSPLSKRISERFEVLLGTRIALERVIQNGFTSVIPVVGENVVKDLKDLIHFRNSETLAALDALKLQYPQYAQKLEQSYLEHSAMRLEESEYHAMLSNAVINLEVFCNLEQNIKQRLREADRIPKLDIGLKANKLLVKVPLFKDLPESAIIGLAGMLKPKLALPGEIIIQKGSRGDSMYFISSGVLMVERSGQCFMLGTGDFFGEIALLTARPRNADVTAKGFCELLTLNRKDFRAFLWEHPKLTSIIEKVAQERIGATQPE